MSSGAARYLFTEPVVKQGDVRRRRLGRGRRHAPCICRRRPDGGMGVARDLRARPRRRPRPRSHPIRLRRCLDHLSRQHHHDVVARALWRQRQLSAAGRRRRLPRLRPGAPFALPVGLNTVGCSVLNSPPPPVAFRCELPVSIFDAEPPVITCPTSIDAGSDPGVCGGAVVYSPQTSDNCTGVVFTTLSGPPSGAVFAVGSTPVLMRATDASGNTASCQLQVRVRDTVPPVVTCPDDIVIAEPGPVVYGMRAEDACGRADTGITPPSGSIFSNPVPWSARSLVTRPATPVPAPSPC